jgi:hypothetical protein
MFSRSAMASSSIEARSSWRRGRARALHALPVELLPARVEAVPHHVAHGRLHELVR